jgi:hypothetical protein
MGTEVISQGVKRPVREADHSAPSNAEVKIGGAIFFIKIRHNTSTKQLTFNTTMLHVSAF